MRVGGRGRGRKERFNPDSKLFSYTWKGLRE